MNTEKAVYKLRLMADTIEELEIDDIISCETSIPGDMSVHLLKLKLVPFDCTWTERFDSSHNWRKSFYYNNIHFYALYTDKEYQREIAFLD